MMANPIINEDGIFWLNSKGQRHREDGGPAVEYSNGVKEWYINDELHREDGPAIMYPNGGSKFWFIRNVRIKDTTYIDTLVKLCYNGAISSIESSLEGKIEYLMNNLTWSEYRYEIDCPGTGWSLYSNGERTDYYIYNNLNTEQYDIFYGNGCTIICKNSLEEAQDLTKKIFKKFPRMSDIKRRGFDAEEFHAIEAFVYSSYSEEEYLNDQCEIFNRQFGELKLDMEEFKQNLRKNRQTWLKS
jgi:hypothetical protein